MDRRLRTEVLIKDKSGLAARLAAEIRTKYDSEEIQPPREGLVMIKMREQARNSLFYLGEVLVTEAKARINGKPGLGIVRGNDDELARDLAIIDAAWNAGLPEIPEWTAALKDAAEKIKDLENIENGKIMRTKVNFASMQEEDYIK